MNELEVSDEFLQEQKLLTTRGNHRKGGPYSKAQRKARQKEVYRLHITFGYTAEEIADMMKVNINTIYNDIDNLYCRLSREYEKDRLEANLQKQFIRLEQQQNRLLQELETSQDKIAIERLILEINNKLIHYYLKTTFSSEQYRNQLVATLNKYAEENKLDVRWVSTEDLRRISPKKYEKIMRMLKE